MKHVDAVESIQGETKVIETTTKFLYKKGRNVRKTLKKKTGTEKIDQQIRFSCPLFGGGGVLVFIVITIFFLSFFQFLGFCRPIALTGPITALCVELLAEVKENGKRELTRTYPNLTPIPI